MGFVTDGYGTIPGVNVLLAELAALQRDFRFAALLAPTRRRPAFAALLLLEATLDRASHESAEPQLALIRLAWWRDQLAKPDTGTDHIPLLAALRAYIDPGEQLALLAEAHMDAIDDVSDMTRGGRLFTMASTVLHDPGAIDPALAGKLGAFWQQGEAVRSGMPAADVEAPMDRVPAALRPLGALCAAAGRDLAGRREPRGTTGRQLAMLRHMLTGRV
jgi:phytoene synthase